MCVESHDALSALLFFLSAAIHRNSSSIQWSKSASRKQGDKARRARAEGAKTDGGSERIKYAGVAN